MQIKVVKYLDYRKNGLEIIDSIGLAPRCIIGSYIQHRYVDKMLLGIERTESPKQKYTACVLHR